MIRNQYLIKYKTILYKKLMHAFNIFKIRLYF